MPFVCGDSDEARSTEGRTLLPARAEATRRGLVVCLWVLLGSFLAGMVFARSAVTAEDYRRVPSSPNEDVFETTSRTAATAFWLVLLAFIALCAHLGAGYILLKRSTWSSRTIWSVSAVVAVLVLVGSLAVLSRISLGHELIIDRVRAEVVSTDRYLFGTSSRAVPVDDIFRIEYEEYEANGESPSSADVSVVGGDGTTDELSTGDLEGQTAIASRLREITGVEMVCVTHPGDPTADDEVVRNCQL